MAERKVRISGAGTAVPMQDSGAYEQGIVNIGKGIENLASGLKSAEEYKIKTEMDQIQLANTIDKALSKSQVDLYKAEAEDRVRGFVASQKNIWNDEKLAENQKLFEEQEQERYNKMIENGELTSEAQFDIQNVYLPSYISQSKTDTDIQIGEAKVRSAISNYDKNILKATNIGDISTANALTTEMLNKGLIDGTTYENKIKENGRSSERGLIRTSLYQMDNTDDLYNLQKNVADTAQYTNLILEDRANLQSEISNRMESVLKSEQLPATRALKNSYSTGTLTEEMIASSKAPKMDKEMFRMMLRYRIEGEYKSIPQKKRDELSRLVNDWMDGGYIGGGGTSKQSENIINFINENKIPSYVILDVLSIMQDGYAGDNAVNYLKLDRNDVKYDSRIKSGMDIFNSEFDALTNDLTPQERLNGYADAYEIYYKKMKETTAKGLGFVRPDLKDVLNEALQPVKQNRLNRDVKRQARSSMGRIIDNQNNVVDIQSPELEYASQLVPNTPLRIVSDTGETMMIPAEDQEEVRNIMKKQNASVQDAWEFYKYQKGK